MCVKQRKKQTKMVNFEIDLKRYSGVWYEFARSDGIPFEPRRTKNVRATYVWDGQTFTIQNDAMLDGKQIQWSTTVKSVKGNTLYLENNQMYQILMLDQDNYQWAVVWSGQWLWILSRNPSPPVDSVLQEIYIQLEDQFHIHPRTLIFTEQDQQCAEIERVYESSPDVPKFKVIIHV